MKYQKGFTLIELLVVISIIGLLSSVVLASLATAREKAYEARSLAEIHQLQIAIEIFVNNKGRYPIPDPNFVIGKRYCIAQGPCYSAGELIQALNTGDFAANDLKLKFATEKKSPWLAWINTAEAYLDGAIAAYPHNTPLIAIGTDRAQYSGPFYVCGGKDTSGNCTSPSIITTSKNPSCPNGSSVINNATSSDGALCVQGATPQSTSTKSH